MYRVFYSGWKGYCGQIIISALKKLGHDVRPWYYKAEWKEAHKHSKWKEIVDAKFISDVNAYNPDVIFILKGGPATPGAYDQIKKENRILMFMTFDDPALLGETHSYKEFLYKGDYIFTSCGDSKKEYEQKGKKSKVAFVGFSPEFYFKDLNSEYVRIYNAEKRKWDNETYDENIFKTDILMTGEDYENRYQMLNYTPTRVDIAKHLVRENFDLSIWGWGTWKNYPELKNAFKGLVYNTALGRLHADAKIVICDFGSRANQCLNLRFFEIMGMGSLNMCYRQQGIPEMFPEDKEVVYWSTLDELVNKCRYYLSHKKERELIAKAGQKHILTDYTTYNQIKKMFEFAGLGKEAK